MAITRFYQDNRDIRSRFETLFADANPTIRVIWENQPEDDAGLSPFPSIDAEFVKIRLRQNDSQQVSTGGPTRRFRHFGVVSVYIQTEAGKGTQRNEQIADAAGQAMASVSVSGLVFRSATYLQVGLHERWYRGVVSIPYQSSFLG